MKTLGVTICYVISLAVYYWNDVISIVGNVNPTNVHIGEDVILSCQVRNCRSPDLEVHLYKWEGSLKKTVYVHKSTTQPSIQGSHLEERDENRIQKGQYINGYLEVTLSKVKAADTGQYVCALTCGQVYKEDTMEMIPRGIIDAYVGEEVILPCPPIVEHDLFYLKIQWRRIYLGKRHTIYSYLFQNTSPVVYSEDTLGRRCTSSNGPNSRVWFGKKYRQKAYIFKGNEFWNKNGYLKLKNIQEEDTGKYSCSVKSNLFHKEVTFQLSVKGIQDQDTDISTFHSSVHLYLLCLLLLGLCFAKSIDNHNKEKRQWQIHKEEFQKLQGEVDNLNEETRQWQVHKEEFQNLQGEVDNLNKEKRQWQIHKEEFQKLQGEVERLKAAEVFLEAHFYRENVVFDPETAHPRLEVSEDGKCVKDTGHFSTISKSKKRFDSHIFILAKDGFSEGKHYWEVEVGPKKNWVLGVASESSCRTGTITLSPRNGYWVIKLEDGKEYWAQESLLNVKVNEKPTKIGIFLNISDKSLGFYDVCRKINMYTFTDTFSEKLYPFFSTGLVTDNLPLRIYTK